MTNLTAIDWAIIAVAVISLRFVSLSTRAHMKGVADFLSANRSAGRYLLTTATAMGGTGVVTFVALFEVYASRGFPPIWWGFLGVLVAAVTTLTGWVFYRFRETRAMTLAQFFEARYNRRVRIFAGILCWTAGILNFGVFPGVAARFIIYFCGLPLHFHPIPGMHLTMSTYASIMALDLSLALMFVTMGGQITVMVTECVQGIVSSIAMIIVIFCVLREFQWSTIVTALNQWGITHPNASMLNPFKTTDVNDFNVWFYLIGIFGAFYGWMSWQGTQGLYSSARAPHEQKMGGILGVWRQIPLSLMALVLPIAAFAVLHLTQYSAAAAAAQATLKTIGNESIRGQMQVPIVMAQVLPAGVKGLLATIMIYFSFTCHDTYMHSWGSIFIQDVLLPIRNKPLTPAEHIRWLRWSIIGVGIFGFVFSLIYPPSSQIFMFFAITGTIWLGGSGACIIGGLYWKRGTSAGAVGALIVGAVLGVAGLIIPIFYKNRFGHEFPINGQWMWLIAIIGAIAVYVILSLLTSKEPFDLERLLHRGKYSLGETVVVGPKQSKWLMLFGITEEFSFGDRIQAVALVVWNFGWVVLFGIVSLMNLFSPFSDTWWANLWYIYLVSQVVISVPATIWFAIGGVIDIKLLFKILDKKVRDDTDDGRILHKAELAPAVMPVESLEPVE